MGAPVDVPRMGEELRSMYEEWKEKHKRASAIGVRAQNVERRCCPFAL